MDSLTSFRCAPGAHEENDAEQIAKGAPTHLFIGGQWITASGGSTFDVINPADGNVLASVANGTAEDAVDAVNAASAAAAGWRDTAPRRRSDYLMNCYRLMIEHKEWLAHLISAENGKALADAESEVLYAAEFFRWYAEEAVRILGEFGTSPSGASQILVTHEPIGISVLITPWNFPAAMATRKIAPALAAGCTCVLKPAAETPLTALAIAQIMHEAGIPAGVVNVLATADAGATVTAMLEDSRVRKLSFTGSTRVGRHLLRKAADQVISCSMELGGNAPFIVLEDADLETAVAGAMVAKMRNGGEACTAANRFYVHQTVAEQFSTRLMEEMSKLRMAPALSGQSDLGPLITEAAVNKVEALVNDAIAQGAHVLTGGSRPDGMGFFYPATVLTNVPYTAAMLGEEIFGPIAPIVTFTSDAEAVAMANRTEYGLVAYIFSENLRHALAVAKQIETGMVGINRGVVSDAAAPFGGMKQSGLGREGSHHGILEYLETKYISLSL